MSFPEFSGLATDDDTPEQTTPVDPVDDDFILVKVGNAYEKMSRRDFDAAMARQDASTSTVPEKPEEEEEFYLHLANGEAVRVKASQVPGRAGTNALNGHFVKDGYAHYVTGVYPVEGKV